MALSPDASRQPKPTAGPRRFDSLEQETFLNLWRTYDKLRAYEDELFGEHDLTPQQYNVLRLLRGEHPRKIATLTLAGRLVSRAPDITRILDKLEKRNLIYRARVPENRRVVEVGISPTGVELLRVLDQRVRECHQQQLGHLSPNQLQLLVELLKKARAPHEDPHSDWI